LERQEPLRFNFTKKSIEALTVDAKRRLVYHDTHAHGLCLRIEPTGRKSFCWLRKVNGQATFKPIGLFPDLTVENARTKAAEFNTQFARWKADAYRGDNPFEERRKDVTLNEALTDYIERRLKTTAKNPERAAKDAQGTYDRYCPPSWKNRQLDGIKKQHILDRHKEIGKDHGHRTADAFLELIRAVYNWAKEHMAWTGENPASNVVPFPKTRRRRFLNAEEIKRLFAAMANEPSRDLQHFVIMALFTGARKGDIFSARWENISFDPAAWTIPNPKSREPYVVPLMSEVVEILKDRQEHAKEGVPWVFPSHGKTGHLTGFKQSWPKLLKRAKITDFTVHDLRRTLASWQAQQNVSLFTVGKSLGHHDAGSTQIYAYLQTENVKKAIETATSAILKAASQEEEQK
jgi:integrase